MRSGTSRWLNTCLHSSMGRCFACICQHILNSEPTIGARGCNIIVCRSAQHCMELLHVEMLHTRVHRICNKMHVRSPAICRAPAMCRALRFSKVATASTAVEEGSGGLGQAHTLLAAGVCSVSLLRSPFCGQLIPEQRVGQQFPERPSLQPIKVLRRDLSNPSA